MTSTVASTELSHLATEINSHHSQAIQQAASVTETEKTANFSGADTTR
jgi:hypothetical protein